LITFFLIWISCHPGHVLCVEKRRLEYSTEEFGGVAGRVQHFLCTGKSYVVQEVSPYTALLTGGTTVANLFGHMSGRQKGMVQIWDVVGFDEVADLQKMPKEVITTMKTYCESGTFQRGQEAVTGDASIAMFGNTNQPIDVMVQIGHLFAPMPDIIRDDMAFIDRLHFYLPGWEIPQMRNELLPITTDSWSTISPKRFARCGNIISPRLSIDTFPWGLTSTPTIARRCGRPYLVS
jgi:hypothetical protein